MKRKYRSNITDRAADLWRRLEMHITTFAGHPVIDDDGKEAIRQQLAREYQLGRQQVATAIRKRRATA